MSSETDEKVKEVGPGPRYTNTEREDVKAKVATMDRMRLTQTEISRRLGISQAQVSRYLAQIREDYKRTQFERHEDNLEMLVAGLGDVRADAYRQWLYSGEDKERRVTVKELREVVQPKVKGGKKKDQQENPVLAMRREMQVVRETIEREGREPGVEWLQLILKTYLEEAKLRGLYVQEDKGKADRVIVLDYAAAKAMVEGGPRHDDFMDKVREVESLPPAPRTHTNGDGHE
jgi:hypothetical protein